MKMIIVLVMVSASFLFSQESGFDFNSPQNIKLFADDLYCTRDYLRAVFEYERYLNVINDDSVKFKLGLSYQKLEEYSKAKEIFLSLNTMPDSKAEYFNSVFKSGNYNDFRKEYSSIPGKIIPVSKLYMYSYFFTEDDLPLNEEYVKLFNNDQRINDFYSRHIDPGYKSELGAALFSAIIPGAGKIYTGQYGDGITAFISTLLLAYISYDNFKAGHNFRGWLFGGLSAIFYAGNIYGSAASAQVYNAGIRLNFENELKFYLNEQNYFMPDYGFCR